MSLTHKPNLLAFGTLVMATALLGGCNQSSKSDTKKEVASKVGTYASVDCSTFTKSQDLPKGASCGYLTVPEKHALKGKSASKTTMEIAVLKIPATKTEVKADPVVYLQGGPGYSAIDSLEDFTQSKAKYLWNDRDFYLVDQRGTGHAKPAYKCTEFNTVKGSIEQVKACKARLKAKGVDFSAYQSVQSAHDFIMLRKALKLDSWNLYGGSYGTRLAETIIREDSQGVRSVILDGVFPIEVNGLSDTPWATYATLDRIIANCDASTKCASEILKPMIESIIARLQNQGEDQAAIRFVNYIANLVGDARVVPLIQAIDKDLNIIIKDKDNEPDEDYFAPMALSVVCSEEYAFLNQTALVGRNDKNWSTTTTLTVDKVFHQGFDVDSCKAWDVAAADSIETQAVTSNLPILVINGGNDHQTPPAWGELVVKNMPNAQLFTNPQGGHVQLTSENPYRNCIDGITMAFLAAPEQKIKTQCTSMIPVFKYN
ncbi:alpha/beta fold hydrolase [Shewanella halotolerans]|uniref:alpha/beta fold hydrolase n=1 Tax=Shewanella halotolerans TaxID=2864204 RepID=UPI001C6607D6|nr:alpha/beta fold hydrolase [Shewanella halotolerans]QYJ90113.1 alpha/beta hydrolase [Shewanella halotolerans]